MPVALILNGQSRKFESGPLTLLALVEQLGSKPDRVAIELNGTIASRARWADILLSEGDRVEIVQFVGGGVPVS